jgi:hypothetical protein
MLNVEQFGGKNRAREEREKIKTPKKKKKRRPYKDFLRVKLLTLSIKLDRSTNVSILFRSSERVWHTCKKKDK